MHTLSLLFKEQRALLIVIILSTVAVLPLFHRGLHPTHDGEYHIIRFYEFDKTLRNGEWYPRWAPDLNNGHGIPLFTYVYPLPNYAASFFHTLGLSFIDSFKAELILTEILGSIFFFFWAKEWWGQKGGVISAVCFAYSPYHFVDLYVRGSVGEAWALCLFPGVLWMLTKTYKKNNFLFPTLTGILLAFTVFSHNIVGLMFFSFYVVYVVILTAIAKRKKDFIISAIYAVWIGVSLSAIFWLPALTEISYVRGLQIFDIKNNFPEIYELFIPSWGWGFTNEDIATHMSYQLGLMNITAIIVSVIVLLKIKKKTETAAVLFFFLLVCLAVIVLMNRVSLPVWDHVPLINNFQFPWRFLSLSIIITSFLAGSITELFRSKLIIVMTVMLTVLLTQHYTNIPYYMFRNDSYYTGRSNFINGTNSPGNLFQTKWIRDVPKVRHNKINSFQLKGTLLTQHVMPTRYSFKIVSKNNQIIILYTSYFPGWFIFIDKQKVLSIPSSDGFIMFSLPSGVHEVSARFGDTLIESIAKIITFTSIITMICFAIVCAKINK